MADFDKAIALQPDQARSYITRGTVKKRKGDRAGALADYAQGLKLDPNAPLAYSMRGWLYYNTQEFTNALADFRKFTQLSLTNDEAHYYVWMSRARLGETDAATKELQRYLGSRGGADDWLFKMGSFLTGQLSEAEFFKAAESDSRRSKEHLCEAYFYAGTKRLVTGDTAGAETAFRNCVTTDVKNFIEYQSAVAQLAFLNKGQK
jgi:lipoprotein NlpI